MQEVQGCERFIGTYLEQNAQKKGPLFVSQAMLPPFAKLFTNVYC